MKRILFLLLLSFAPLLLYAGTTDFLSPGLSGTIAGDSVFTGTLDIDADGVRLDSDNDGMLILTGLGNGSDEDLRLNLDDTSNTGVFTSTTSLATLNFSSIALQESGNGVINVTDCINVLSTEHNPTEAGATNDYVSLNLTGAGGSAFSSTETDNDTFMVPVAMVARNLRVEVATAPGAGNDAWIVTVRDDTASTALTCTIDETATNCSDTSNAPAIAAGSKLDVLVDSSGPGADPTASATMNIAFCLGQ